MRFLKSLMETVANKHKYGGDFPFTWGPSKTFIFEDKTNPKYPYIKIWSDGTVYIFDSEGKSYEADDEMIQHYCSMSDKELVARYSTSF